MFFCVGVCVRVCVYPITVHLTRVYFLPQRVLVQVVADSSRLEGVQLGSRKKK